MPFFVQYLKRISTISELGMDPNGGPNRFDNTFKALASITPQVLRDHPDLKAELERVKWVYVDGPYIISRTHLVEPGKEIEIRFQQKASVEVIKADAVSYMELRQEQSPYQKIIVPRIRIEDGISIYKTRADNFMNNGSYGVAEVVGHKIDDKFSGKIIRAITGEKIPGSRDTIVIAHSSESRPDPLKITSITQKRVKGKRGPMYEVNIQINPGDAGITISTAEKLAILTFSSEQGYVDFRPTQIGDTSLHFEIPASVVSETGLKIYSLSGVFGNGHDELLIEADDPLADFVLKK